MEYLKKIEDINTVEIAQRVLNCIEDCNSTECDNCYLFNVGCVSAKQASKKFIDEHKAEPATKEPKDNGFIDPHYMETKDKEIESVEEAICACISVIGCAGTDCKTCASKMYGSCELLKRKANLFLTKELIGKETYKGI